MKGKPHAKKKPCFIANCFEKLNTYGIALPPDDNNQLAIWGWESSCALSYLLNNGKKKLLNKSLARGVAYNHSGSRLATIVYNDSYDPKIFIWDSKTAKKLHCITRPLFWLCYS